jgi:hypothetical protein
MTTILRSSIKKHHPPAPLTPLANGIADGGVSATGDPKVWGGCAKESSHGTGEWSQVIVCICSYCSCKTHNNKLNIGVNGRRREKDVHWIRAYVMLATEVCTKSRRWEKMTSLLYNAWHCFCKLMILTFNGWINLIMCLLISVNILEPTNSSCEPYGKCCLRSATLLSVQ